MNKFFWNNNKCSGTGGSFGIGLQQQRKRQHGGEKEQKDNNKLFRRQFDLEFVCFFGCCFCCRE